MLINQVEFCVGVDIEFMNTVDPDQVKHDTWVTVCKYFSYKVFNAPASKAQIWLYVFLSLQFLFSVPVYAENNQQVILDRIDKRLESNPIDLGLLFQKGKLLSSVGRYAEARDVFLLITQEYPGLPEPYNNLGVVYAALAEYELAEQALDEAIKRYPKYAVAYKNKGDLYTKMAEASYKRAEELRSSVVEPSNEEDIPAEIKSEQIVSKPLDPTRSCFAVGPIAEESQAKAIKERLLARQAEVNLYTQEQATETLYRVYLDTGNFESKALALIQDLRSQGYTDYWHIKEGEFAHAISLGVFSTADAAGEHVAVLRKLGYGAKILEYSELQRQFWLNFAWLNQNELDKDLESILIKRNLIALDCNNMYP